MITLNKIYNQDCREVFKLIPDEFVHLVVTDCEYKIKTGGARIEIEGEGENKYKKNDPKGVLARPLKVICKDKLKNKKWLKKNPSSDNLILIQTGGFYEYSGIKFDEWLPEIYRVLKNGSHAYIMINSQNLKTLQVEAEKAGFVFQNLLVWKKQNKTANKYWMQQCEFILMLRKGRAKNVNNMGLSNVLEVPNIIGNKKHPTEKPVELNEILIKQSSSTGDIVFDPFIGAGSLALACINTRRNFIGCERMQEYAKIADERIRDYAKQLINI